MTVGSLEGFLDGLPVEGLNVGLDGYLVGLVVGLSVVGLADVCLKLGCPVGGLLG